MILEFGCTQDYTSNYFHKGSLPGLRGQPWGNFPTRDACLPLQPKATQPRVFKLSLPHPSPSSGISLPLQTLPPSPLTNPFTSHFLNCGSSGTAAVAASCALERWQARRCSRTSPCLPVLSPNRDESFCR